MPAHLLAERPVLRSKTAVFPTPENQAESLQFATIP